LPQAVEGAPSCDWQPANDGLAGRALIGLSLAPDFAQHPLMAVASLDGGVSISVDGGATWTTSLVDESNAAVSSVAILPRPDGSHLILATAPSGLFRSRDQGTSWERVYVPGDADQVFTSISVATGSSAVVAAGAGVLALSLDSGENWRTLPPPT